MSRIPQLSLRSFFALALTLLLVPQVLLAQEAAEPSELDRIVAKNLEARGGLEAIQAIQSLRIEGVIEAQGMQLPMVMQRERPNRFRMEMDMQGMKMINAYDGEMAWGMNPMMGETKPTPVEGPQAAAAASQGDFDGPFVDTAKKGITLELVGKESVGEREAFHIKATHRDGRSESIYLDAETYLRVKAVAEGDLGMGPMEVEVLFDGWADVDGVKMPQTQTMNSPMGAIVTSFNSYAANVDIDEDVFFMPGQAADASLTLTQILERHRKARISEGSPAIDSVSAKGSLGLMGFELPLEMAFVRSGACRLDADMAGTEMTLAYDGKETAWTVSPMQGIVAPEALEPEGVEAIALFSEFLWGLLDGQDETSLKFAGIEKVGRDETYKIIVGEGSDLERSIFLGGEDFLEHKLALRTVFLGSEADIVALMGDYSRTDGLAVPGSIELQTGGTPAASIAIAEVTTNATIDPSIFALPEPEADPEG
ncbi:MAG: hypothetical protein AAGA81_18295 [Acidobacteriota bacterium]